MLSKDAKKVLKLLKKKKVIAMAAPSFVVDFNCKTFADNLRSMGFDKVTELTFGAREVNMFYRKHLKEFPDKLWVSTACPAVVDVIVTKFPHLKGNLIPGVSPMVAMAKIVHKEFPKYKIVFISPCYYKKKEAHKFSDVDIALTFKETKELMDYCKQNNLMKKVKKRNYFFDQFYNDATKVYPLSGGLAKSMHAKEILKKDEILITEGRCMMKVLEEFDNYLGHVKFLDILFCKGGCIGGPGIISKKPVSEKKKKVLDYMKFAKKHKTGEKAGLDKFLEGLNFRVRNFRKL